MLKHYAKVVTEREDIFSLESFYRAEELMGELRS